MTEPLGTKLSRTKLLRGRTLSFNRRPLSPSDHESYTYQEDGAILIQDGIITAHGEYASILQTAPDDAEIIDHHPHLLMPGFIDPHLHFPQIQMTASWAPDLLTWLNTYTFIEEQKYRVPDHSTRMAGQFFYDLIAHGTTTCVAFCSVHKASADAFFTEASQRNMRVISGKVMMDRNAPDGLLDTAQSSYDDTKAVIDQWHGYKRSMVAITPRFVVTSTHEQMEMASSLKREYPDLHMQTHLSENKDEVEFACSLYPKAKNYTDIYAQYDLLGPKSLFGHAIHLNKAERKLLSESGSIAVHCPTSNLFLGSGLFKLEKMMKDDVRIALATDIGGGTSFSMLKTMDEAYKIQQLRGYRLNALESYWWATRGNADALSLTDKIGTLDVGSEADIIALNVQSTPTLKARSETLSTLSEELFLIQTMGDDRAISAVYVAGDKQK